MPISQLSADKVYEALQKDPDAIYLDVRSVPEFQAGHPEGAKNVPLMHQNETTGSMEANADFLQIVTANFSKDASLFVGCLRGGRSMKVCQILEANGYSNLTNVEGGFGGAIDPISGRITQEGWKDLGLPISQEAGAGESYESLAQKK